MNSFFRRDAQDPEWLAKLLGKGPYAPPGTMGRGLVEPLPPERPAPPSPFVPPAPYSPEPLPGMTPASPPVQTPKVPGLRHYDKPLHLRFGDQKLEVQSLTDLPDMTEEQVRSIDQNLYGDLFGDAHASLVPAWIAIEKHEVAKAMAKANAAQSKSTVLTTVDNPKPLLSLQRSAVGASDKEEEFPNRGRITRSEHLSTIRTAISSAATKISFAIGELRKLSLRVEQAQQKNEALSAEDQRIVNRVQQISHAPNAKIAITKVNDRLSAARGILRGGGFRLEYGTCPGDDPYACVRIGGRTVRFRRLFFDTISKKQASIMGHEAFHMAGAGHPEAEDLERLVFGFIANLKAFPVTRNRGSNSTIEYRRRSE